MEQEPQTKGGEQQDDVNERDRAHASPKIYVASLADYNDGRLHGAWLDAAQEPEALYEQVGAMLARSPVPGAEEFAIHDYENFGPLRIGEYENLGLVSKLARGVAEHGPAFAHWAALVGTADPDELDRFEDAYLGHAESLEAYAEELLEDLGYPEMIDRSLPEHLQPYVHIDVGGFARDLELSGEIMTSEGDGGVYVFDQRR
jgi:antirestriction protein